jgi:hypothetical protein
MAISTDFQYRHRHNAPEADPELDLLGPLRRFLGGHKHMKIWRGHGFNMIWRPNFDNQSGDQDEFLELNRTREELSFTNITGTGVANRAAQQKDVFLGALSYLQQVSDVKTGPIHFEPGVWANIPATTVPVVPIATVTRMGSIPHGTTINAPGTVLNAATPQIDAASIIPFTIGQPGNFQPQIQDQTPINLDISSRTHLSQVPDLDQAHFLNPNMFLRDAIQGQNISNTAVFFISTQPPLDIPGGVPSVGGGTDNIEFLLVPPNADATLMTAIFWVETVTNSDGSTFEQLQYTQRVLLNFNGLSWPHISVATLR